MSESRYVKTIKWRCECGIPQGSSYDLTDEYRKIDKLQSRLKIQTERVKGLREVAEFTVKQSGLSSDYNLRTREALESDDKLKRGLE